MGNFAGVFKIEQMVVCCTFVAKMEHCEQNSNAELQVRLFSISRTNYCQYKECAFIVSCKHYFLKY